MLRATRSGSLLCGIFAAIILAVLAGWISVQAADPSPKSIKSGVVSFDDAKKTHEGNWGELRGYFTGDTLGTKDVLTGVAVIKPGEAIHRPHRHVDEEYFIITVGSGTWLLEGKEFLAKQGDILYVEPWVYHGLKNTGTTPLTCVVVKYTCKGIALPPRPNNRPDEP